MHQEYETESSLKYFSFIRPALDSQNIRVWTHDLLTAFLKFLKVLLMRCSHYQNDSWSKAYVVVASFSKYPTMNYESFEEELSKKIVEVKVATESDDVSMRRTCWFGYECNSINNLIVKEVPFLRSIE